jgi:hypothetical protein
MPVSAAVVNTDYQEILFRSASSAEIGMWSSLDETNTDIVDAIEHSPEALTYVDPLIRLYQGAFDRAPDVNGLASNVNTMRDGHHSLEQMAGAFVSSAEFVQTYGALSDSQYVEQLYHNILDRVGSQTEVDAWLATGASRAHILVGFTESTEFLADSATGVQHFLDQLAAGQTPASGPLAGPPPPTPAVELLPDATLDALGQSQTNPGTLLTGTGIPAAHGAATIDDTTGTELWFLPDYRTSATSFQLTGVDADGTVHYSGLAGAQDGTHGEQGSNATHGALALNFAAISGVNGFQNNQIKLFLDTDPTSATNFNELDLHVINGAQVWTDTKGNPIITDDPQALPNSVAENTANMMFGYWLGNAHAPATGTYDVIMTETPLVGQTMTNHIVITLV